MCNGAKKLVKIAGVWNITTIPPLKAALKNQGATLYDAQIQ